MKKLTDHHINDLNRHLEVTAMTPPLTTSGACTLYLIEGYHNFEPAERWPNGKRIPFVIARLAFQEGATRDSGDYNGITNEVLLAVVIDRLRGFLSGEFSCRENALALTKLEEALMWLGQRSREREARGVEGVHQA